MISNWLRYTRNADDVIVSAAQITSIKQAADGSAVIRAAGYDYPVSSAFMSQWNPLVTGWLVATAGGGNFIYIGNTAFTAQYSLFDTVTVTPDNISGSTAIGRGVLTAATASDALTAIGVNVTWRNVMLTQTPTDTNMNAFAAQNGLIRRTATPTTTVRAGVLQVASPTAVPAITATAATASTATDVAGIVADHNALVTQYNALRTSAVALQAFTTSLVTQLRAAGIIA